MHICPMISVNAFLAPNRQARHAAHAATIARNSPLTTTDQNGYRKESFAKIAVKT